MYTRDVKLSFPNNYNSIKKLTLWIFTLYVTILTSFQENDPYTYTDQNKAVWDQSEGSGLGAGIHSLKFFFLCVNFSRSYKTQWDWEHCKYPNVQEKFEFYYIKLHIFITVCYSKGMYKCFCVSFIVLYYSNYHITVLYYVRCL